MIRKNSIRLKGSTEIAEYSVAWTGLDHGFTRSTEGFDKIPFVPDHQVETIGVIHLGPRFDLRGVWLASGGRVAYDRGEKIELGTQSQLDLGLAARVGVAELSLQIDNVFDTHIDIEPGYPLPGRRVWAGVRFAL